MKTKLLVILCVLIFAGAAMVGPVAGATGISTITGNITSVMQLTVTNGAGSPGGDITNWALGLDSNINSTDVRLHVFCNYPGWAVTVNDSLDASKPSTSRGKMAQSNAGVYTGYYNLSTPMSITGTDSPNGYYTQSGGPLNTVDPGVPHSLYGGNTGYLGAGDFTLMPLTIQQTVIFADPVLPSGQLYRIVVTFVGSLP